MSNGASTILSQSRNNESQLFAIRDEVTILKAQFSGIVADVSGIGISLNEVKTAINGLAISQAQRDKPNWGVILGALMFMGVLIGGCWTILGLKTEASVSPLVSSVAVLQKEHDSDRALVASLTDNINKLSALQMAQTSKVDEKLSEVETQFRALQQIQNGASADLWRVATILWDALSESGAKMPHQPSGPYFSPDISSKK
jgi:prefoldin subunit 5